MLKVTLERSTEVISKTLMDSFKLKAAVEFPSLDINLELVAVFLGLE